METESDVPSLLVEWLKRLVGKTRGNPNKIKRRNQWCRPK